LSFMLRASAWLVVVLAAVLALPQLAAARQRPSEPVEVQLLSFTDLHGYLAPPTSAADGTIATPGGVVTVGGAAYLAAHVERLRRGERNSILFSAGDAWSGWPFETNAHADEPTIEVLNELGIDFNTLGNHELDDGIGDLVRKQVGRCWGERAVDTCFRDSTGRGFRGADFPTLSANFVHARSGSPVLRPYVIEHVRGPRGRRIPVGFINLTTPTTHEGTTSLVTGPYRFDPLLEATDRAVAALQRLGVEAIVVVAHEGGTDASLDPFACLNPSGPMVDYARQASPEVDAIVTGHWHAGFNCSIDDPAGRPRPVVEMEEHGKLLSEIRLALDPRSGDVIRERTRSITHLNTRDVTPDPAIARIVEHWVARGAERYDMPVAQVRGDVLRTPDPATGESALANLAADMHRAIGASEGAEVGLASPPNLPTTPHRGDLRVAPGPTPGDAPGTVLLGEAFNAYGYGNPVTTVTLTGAALEQVLEQQWRSGAGGAVTRHILGVSENVRVTYDERRPVGDRIDPAQVTIDGEPLDLTRRYRVASLAYLVLGADGFTAARDHTERERNEYARDVDSDAFVRWLRTLDAPIDPAALRSRIGPAGAEPEAAREALTLRGG
jgi:5'-nucleotidase